MPTNNYTLYPRLAEVKSSQVEKSEKKFDDNEPNQMHILSPWTKHLWSFKKIVLNL